MSTLPLGAQSYGDMGDVERAAAKIDQIRISTGHCGLCFRCRHAFITASVRHQEPRIMCGQIGQRMPPDITACSRFIANGQLTIFELIQMCDPMDILSKQRAGFKPEKP